ncbi:MAG: hypothetical protein H7Y88_05905 [Phycisphaerales bacterium]|nr:hypothetical protein [Phycisphaerales bacterium]
MLIAVAAVGIIAVGIAQVFRATGETVKLGRRLSSFNSYARLLERQMRADFGSMTREGFLVIRNELANDGGVTSLYADEPTPRARPRRVDEIAFFASGSFTSLREPVHPERVARSNAARIYYGHGLKYNPTSQFSIDPVPLDNAGAPANLQPFGFSGPNQSAGSWILARHVTLLCTPGTGELTGLDPDPTAFGNGQPGNISEMPDNDIQIALQPAASDIFRDACEFVPDPLPGDPALVRDGSPERPIFETGVIDIATTSLDEIRSMVLLARPSSGAPATTNLDAGDFPLTMAPSVLFEDATSGSFPVSGGPVDMMQAWMRQGLPAASDGPLVPVPSGYGVHSRRIRTELVPPNYLGVGSAQQDYERTDQVMLTSSVFVPSCSSFIVEWSYGNTYPYPQNPTPPDYFAGREGELVWHGMERWNDLDFDGVQDTGEVMYAQPYDDQANTPNTPPLAFQQYAGRNGATAPPRLVRSALIHDIDTVDQTGLYQQLCYSHFGYIDPTFQPVGANDPDSIPWPWPKLIRITLTLTDPREPINEQTLQFVFEVPAPQ